MGFIIECIMELLNIKDPKNPQNNEIINALIVILIFFGIFVAILWGFSKLGLFG